MHYLLAKVHDVHYVPKHEVMMPRVDAPLTKATIYVYYGDHAPPHFHVVGPDTNVLIDLRTLQVMRGKYTRQALAEAIEWAADNLAVLWSEWRRCNERD